MNKVRMTVRQTIELGLWDRVVEYLGWDPYVVAEGRVELDEVIEFDSDFKKEEKELSKETKKMILDCVLDCENPEEFKNNKAVKALIAQRNLLGRFLEGAIELIHGEWEGNSNYEK